MTLTLLSLLFLIVYVFVVIILPAHHVRSFALRNMMIRRQGRLTLSTQYMTSTIQPSEAEKRKNSFDKAYQQNDKEFGSDFVVNENAIKSSKGTECNVDCDCAAKNRDDTVLLDDRQVDNELVNHVKVEQKGRITMYKKEGCPFCLKAKLLLEGKYGLTVTYVDIKSEQSEDILNQMRTFSGGRNTVPQIFFNAEHLGGNDDVQKLDIDGILIKKIETMRSTPVSMMMDHWFHPWY